MQTPVCIYKHNCFSIWRSRGEELHGGQQSFYCFHSQDIGYIACQRRRRRFWIRPGQTAVWWENFEKEVVLPDECHENFRMSRSSLLSLSELLHPSIEGQTTVMRSPVSLVKKNCPHPTIYPMRVDYIKRIWSVCIGRFNKNQLGGVFMRVHVNRNFFENDLVCTTLFFKTEGQKYLFL